MTTTERRREGRRIRRRAQGKPYTTTITLYPVLDGRFVYAQFEGRSYLIGEISRRPPRPQVLHNGRKPR